MHQYYASWNFLSLIIDKYNETFLELLWKNSSKREAVRYIPNLEENLDEYHLEKLNWNKEIKQYKFFGKSFLIFDICTDKKGLSKIFLIFLSPEAYKQLQKMQLQKFMTINVIKTIP